MKFKNLSKHGNLHFAVFPSQGEKVLAEELKLLEGAVPQGFLNVRQTGRERFDYTGEQLIFLPQYLAFPLSRYGFFTLVEEFMTLAHRCRDVYLDPGRFILNPSWVCVREQTGEPFLAYFPCVQVSSKMDIPLDQRFLVFLVDLINLCIPMAGQGHEFLMDFYEFLKLQKRFEESAVEDYIIRIDENIYHNVKNKALMERTGPSLNSPPRLLRVGTGESMPITRPVFRIGKEYACVDFCVAGNSAISRLHADIICHDGKYFIKDLNSRNKTCLNGQELPGMTEVAIQPGCEILLANEAFIFGY